MRAHNLAIVVSKLVVCYHIFKKKLAFKKIFLNMQIAKIQATATAVTACLWKTVVESSLDNVVEKGLGGKCTIHNAHCSAVQFTTMHCTALHCTAFCAALRNAHSTLHNKGNN